MNAPQDDIDRLMAIMHAAFDPYYGEAWTRRQVEDALLIGNCHYLLVNNAGETPQRGEMACGFSLSRTGFREEELLLFAVMPEFRGRGLGRAMLERLARDAASRSADRLLLEMRKGNPVEALYCAFGFQPIGMRPAYYRMSDGNRVDAITFACSIGEHANLPDN